MATEYLDEKLPAPVTARPEPPKRTVASRILGVVRFFVIFYAAFFISDAVFPETGDQATAAVRKGCHGMRHKAHGMYKGFGDDDHHHRGGKHHGPDTSKWIPVSAETHFELSPEDAKGLTIKGAHVFGGIVFETSKLSDKVVLDLDVKTNVEQNGEEVTINYIDGKIEIDTPMTGDLKTHASAKIQIPSNLLGTFGLPAFDVEAPRHMVDLSNLPESLEIGELTIRLAMGFVKAGKVHTNTTQITVAKGAIRGDLKLGRESTSIDVSSGNVTVNVDGISAGETGTLNIKLAKGDLKGSFPVFKSTTLDIAKGDLDATLYVKKAVLGEDEDVEISTKVASGDARVTIKSIDDGAASINAAHTTISGSQELTYPASFEGTIEARGLVGDIKLAGEGLVVERAWFGSVGKKGDAEKNMVKVKTAKGDIDVLVGKE
ncbi:hypothetical protein BCR37DRAFT_239863 [Protomyces lactucae-debilis]|uniref:Uncharacterized protein n=1 Tax=Protomyces lactucae-debilis TaxID=2754530 RepID=A0A1Y2FQJ9_PROLT|nr:uncharacterized protein BCR37DRAFT_239863 [Protomyces lactucae-debilis]ORY85486.1 hypothetical protein BCR37DRAFT_239863 [Protomyces lactucae-debilis]